MSKKSPNPIDVHVGARVRMRRLMLDRSQTDLGAAVGVTFQQVQKYEKGTNRIGASRLQQISQFLQVPMTFFFEGLPGPTRVRDGGFAAAELVNGFFTLPYAAELARHYIAIPHGVQRRLIVDLARIAADKATAAPKRKAA